MKIRLGVVGLFGVAALTSVPTGESSAQATQDSTPVLIRAGRLYDSERAAFTGPRDVLVRGGTIAEVAERITAPAGARVIDLSRFSVLPGLIDAHTQSPLSRAPVRHPRSRRARGVRWVGSSTSGCDGPGFPS